MHWTRLNVFQRLTRQWDAIHPYNAAQAMRLAGAPDLDRVQSTWRDTLNQLGIGRARFAGDSYRHETLDAVTQDRCTVAVAADVTGLMTRELNRSFDPILPLRAFVIPEPDSHWLCVTYHHWAADSASIRMLLREWFYRQYDPLQARGSPMRFARGGYWRHFGPSRGRWDLPDGIGSAVRWSMRLRQARRVESRDYGDLTTRFSLHELPDGSVEPLVQAARNRRATVNDIFLAVLAQVCDTLVPVKRTRRRNDLALGTIVDLRSGVVASPGDAFGLFLGFTSVICRPQDLRDFDRLLSRIARQSAHHRRTSAPQTSMIRMSAGLMAHRLFSRQRLLNWYRKRVPLAGGISNVNLNRDWPGKYHPDPLLGYVRVSPCGPMMPMVFTPTTLGARLNFGLTCRESVITLQLQQQIAAMFKARLSEIARTQA